MFKTYFSDLQVSILILGFTSLLLTLLFHVYKKESLTVIFLVLSSFLFFLFAALLDPFLNLWDERFHALVAKNMMNDFFKPTLYKNPYFEFSWRDWSIDHIWLHKQPLFLWQIALSFKLFGVSELSLRLPSVLLGTCLTYTNYRCGKLLINRNVGILAGIFTFSTIYLMELVSGRYSTDHNDLVFLAYVSFSIWSLLEYYSSRKTVWLILIGLFSGFAILTKWLVGLFVFLIWGLYKLQVKEFSFQKNKNIFISLLISILIAAPWQIYIFIKYPKLAAEEFNHSSSHFLEAIEGHQGDFWYHFDKISEIYGVLFSLFIILGFYFWFKKTDRKKMLLVFCGAIAFVYLFFSLASTKMPSFTIILSSFIFIAVACFYNVVIEAIKFKKLKNIIFVSSVLLIVLLRVDIEKLQEKHTTWKENWYTDILTHNKKLFCSLKLPEEAILFNVINFRIDAMFYTERPAYWFIPDELQYKKLKKDGKLIVIFNASKIDLPLFLKNDNQVLKIEGELYE